MRRRVAPAGDRAGGPALERRAQVVDLADVDAAQGHDECAPPRLLLHQALGAQELERLAHRPAADVELAGDAGLDEMGAPRQAAGEDLGPQDVGRVLGERARQAQGRQAGEVGQAIRPGGGIAARLPARARPP